MSQQVCTLYSFRRCPFAIRARWALAITGVKLIIREVSLKNKPKELIKASKKGTVPVLITEKGEIIDESIEIMRWAIKRKSKKVFFKERLNVDSERIKFLINNNDKQFKYHLDHFKYASKYKNIIKEEHRNEALKILYILNREMLNTSSNSLQKWLVGDSESLADWAIWPFIRQFRNVDPISFDEDKNLRSIHLWLNYFLNHDIFKVVMEKYDIWESGSEKDYFPR